MEWEEGKVPRVCGTCQSMEEPYLRCAKSLPMEYPLMVTETECPEYLYKPDHRPPADVFTVTGLPECATCGHNVQSRCSGKGRIPFKREPRCEFWRHYKLTCKYAVPFLQYGTNYRNNYCTLPPEKRQPPTPDARWCCINAHITEMKRCWEPLSAYPLTRSE